MISCQLETTVEGGALFVKGLRVRRNGLHICVSQVEVNANIKTLSLIAPRDFLPSLSRPRRYSRSSFNHCNARLYSDKGEEALSLVAMGVATKGHGVG